jgi:NTE family protein
VASSTTRLSHAVELGAERVFVLPTREPGARTGHPPQTALDTAIYGLGLTTEGRLQKDIARYSRDVELVVLPAANPAGVQPTSFEHSARLINQALIAARAQLTRHDAGRHLRLVS